MAETKLPATEPIQLPADSSNGLYVAFEPAPERIKKGARITPCKRCGKLVAHWPQDSAGYEIICLGCAHQVPAIHKHLDQLAKTHG